MENKRVYLYKTALFALLTHTAFAEAPDVPILLDNQTSCSLELLFHSSYQAELSLPENVEPFSQGSGRITFKSGFFFGGHQQQATAQYIATCQNQRHPLSFNFFVAIDETIEAYRHYLETESQSAPLLIIPYGRVALNAHAPLEVTLIDASITPNDTYIPDEVDENMDDDKTFIQEEQNDDIAPTSSEAQPVLDEDENEDEAHFSDDSDLDHTADSDCLGNE